MFLQYSAIRYEIRQEILPQIQHQKSNLKYYRVATKKKPKSFLRYLNKFLSHSVDFFSRIYSKVWIFFGAHFWGVQALVTLIFHAFFAFRPPKKGLKRPKWPQNQKFNYVTICPKPWHYRYRGHIFGTFSPPKAFFEPITQNNIFWSFFDPKFSKNNFFFVWKNQRLNGFIDLKIWFSITSLHVLSTANTICPYLKKIFWSKNIWYFGLRKESKYQIFLDQNIFLRYGHVVLGVLRICKEVLENQILRSINPFKRWFFQTKKNNFFRKFRVEKWPKNVILSYGFKKRFWGRKGAEYMTPISKVSRFGAYRNIVKFLILRSYRPFWAFF